MKERPLFVCSHPESAGLPCRSRKKLSDGEHINILPYIGGSRLVLIAALAWLTSFQKKSNRD